MNFTGFLKKMLNWKRNGSINCLNLQFPTPAITPIPNTNFMTRKLYFLLLFAGLLFSNTGRAQDVPDTPIEHDIGIHDPKLTKPKVRKVSLPFIITGRVIGVNLENVPGVIVINTCTAEKTSTDKNGIYHINVAKGDTLDFEVGKYSSDVRGIRSNENLNIVMIKRKTDNLPPGYSKPDYNKAKNDDDELYRILQKDAKLEDKWKY